MWRGGKIWGCGKVFWVWQKMKRGVWEKVKKGVGKCIGVLEKQPKKRCGGGEERWGM